MRREPLSICVEYGLWAEGAEGDPTKDLRRALAIMNRARKTLDIQLIVSWNSESQRYIVAQIDKDMKPTNTYFQSAFIDSLPSVIVQSVASAVLGSSFKTGRVKFKDVMPMIHRYEIKREYSWMSVKAMQAFGSGKRDLLVVTFKQGTTTVFAADEEVEVRPLQSKES